MQIGYSSNIDLDSFQNQPANILLLIDVSGSMGWNYGNLGRPAQITNALATSVVREMGHEDKVAIVTFDSNAYNIQSFISGDHQDLLLEKLNTLSDGGSTNMEAGLKRAALMMNELDNETTLKRVILLTDAQPNTGATSPGTFMDIAHGLAQSDIGLTLIGCGIGVNPEVMSAMINLRGANGFSLNSVEEVNRFMADNWPYFTYPLAYDLQIAATPGNVFTVDNGYGFPGGSGELHSATIFASNRRGALMIELTGGQFDLLSANLALSYTTPRGDPVEQTIDLQIPAGAELDDAGRYFTQYSVQKTTALALLTDNLHQAAEVYKADSEQAVSLVSNAVTQFESDIDALISQNPADETALRRELQMANDLLILMQEGAPQNSLYGG